jgi:hypothetical protein
MNERATHWREKRLMQVPNYEGVGGTTHQFSGATSLAAAGGAEGHAASLQSKSVLRKPLLCIQSFARFWIAVRRTHEQRGKYYGSSAVDFRCSADLVDLVRTGSTRSRAKVAVQPMIGGRLDRREGTNGIDDSFLSLLDRYAEALEQEVLRIPRGERVPRVVVDRNDRNHSSALERRRRRREHAIDPNMTVEKIYERSVYCARLQRGAHCSSRSVGQVEGHTAPVAIASRAHEGAARRTKVGSAQRASRVDEVALTHDKLQDAVHESVMARLYRMRER